MQRKIQNIQIPSDVELCDVKPTAWKVLIQHHPEKKMTDGGIILPDKISALSKEKLTMADVIAVGPGRNDDVTGEFQPTVVKPGQTVIVNAFMGDTIEHRNEEYRMLQERDILAVVTTED